mgnify:CR=1 FL=1
MILAAGLGLRMRPITKTLPKPLIKVAGKPLIGWAIDRLEEAGVEQVVVNLHHLGHLVRQHLDKRPAPEILFSPEKDRLETGGGVVKALPMLGGAPFYVINADALWLNGAQGALARMAQAWDGRRMDGLLLLHFTVDAYGYRGLGDFLLDQTGGLVRRPESEISPYLFTGVQILHPRLFKGVPEGPFSLNAVYDKALEKGRLHGVLHDGEWFHIGTPEGLAEAEVFMGTRYAGIRRR